MDSDFMKQWNKIMEDRKREYYFWHNKTAWYWRVIRVLYIWVIAPVLMILKWSVIGVAGLLVFFLIAALVDGKAPWWNFL